MKDKYLYYCPKCGKTEYYETERTKNYVPYKITLINFRDGYGHIFEHYLCDCGNALAGLWLLRLKNKDDEIEYAKDIITEYNEGGSFYTDELLKKAIKNSKYKEA